MVGDSKGSVGWRFAVCRGEAGAETQLDAPAIEIFGLYYDPQTRAIEREAGSAGRVEVYW